ncbi:MAG TPA: sigma-70 family RNA polymerase sigma factor [Thermomonas sp.]|jgi:RNA polymerase sigma-70 factor (ECF subfamily)|uniref:sigma-70 family RNA polymerase sigma factor n=1 Tax=Thermomonas sp. TaxID=1971895 RepID=UPI002D1DF971|nr:sigma-70 family RNA polymerase sigma factor [Thermomonas sp.]HOZ23948.1 sigma-70 family RNA polymerase sigma factor [Thermomonas sp.]HPW11696.1 sigma-70 family RNA polymerase sigma factor [Thermomonas sp.]
MSAIPLQQSLDGSADPLAALLAQVAEGRRDAFESLYRQTSATMLGICLRVLRDREEAEDVLQEVYVAVWSKAAQFDQQRARAMTWLGTIARNRAIDRVRARPSPALHEPIEDHELADDEAPTPAAGIDAALERAQLDDCMDQLEPKRRSLIRTAFFENVTYDVLALRAEAPLGSVKSWIRRGLQQLKACLER